MARYNLDEMAIMAKERRIDSNNLQDVMESLANYNITNDTVRYILEELVKSDNMPKEYRKWIDDVLDNYDEIKELIDEDIIEPKALDNIDVKEAIMDEAPKIDSSQNDNTSQEGSSDDTTNLESPKEEVVIEEPLVDVTENMENETEQFNNDITQIPEEAALVPNEEVPVVTESMGEVLELEGMPYIIDNSNQVFAISSNYQENEIKLENIKKLALEKGINIISSKVNEHDPLKISMELTPESKPYLDNLLLQLHGDNKNNLNIELVKDDKTGKEMLVMEVNSADLSHSEVQRYEQEMLTSITEIIESTDKSKDYEKLMSPELREIRDKFHADEPDVIKDSDVEIVTSKEDGQSLYHIVADSLEEAKTAAEQMGVSIKEDHGGGVFEIDDRNIPDMKNTKIGIVSKDVNYTDEVKEIKDSRGLSDLDINYNNEHYYPDTKTSGAKEIMDFIQESNEDERTISRITVDNYGDQRVVKLSDTNGYNDTIVINEKESFDNFVLPAIASSFAKDTDVSGSKTFEESGRVGYFGENNKNTQLVINGYDEKNMNRVESQIEKNKVQEKELANTNNNAKAYGKVLGVYPTRAKEAANTSFITLLVFTLVVILGIAVIYIVFGG